MKDLKVGCLFLFAGIIFLITGCKKDIVQGRESLEGTWKVIEIESLYAEMTVSESDVTEIGEADRTKELGDLGFFNFNDNQVSYQFTRNDTVFNGSSSWKLKLEKVNQGFFKTNEWTLFIENDLKFDLRFEDETKNSEKKAKTIELDNWPKKSGYGVAYFLKLKKL